MKFLLRFYKNWALPISMLLGVLSYLIYVALPLPAGTGIVARKVISIMQPTLIFAMLFLTFCKLRPTDLKPCRWHAWLLLIQVGMFSLMAALLILFPHLPGRLLVESAMICFICPTACAAAVVCAKLGGSAAHLTSYILLINIAAALAIPLIVPLVNPHEGQTFLAAFLLVLRHVFPTLICPLLLAWLIRYTMPRLARRLQNTGDTAFYLWTIALTMAIAVTTRSIANSNVSITTLIGIALVTLVCCWTQFTIGRRIGRSSGDQIAAGQAIGQKNTVFAIWMAYTFLTPITAIAGGCYSVWHNIFNSYQLYYRRKEKK
jgi:BASS family bile acid:Na+ symporter